MSINFGKKQHVKNILLNLLAFLVQFIVSFYISPVIVKKIGASAYGFIGLANDFVSYAGIISSIFNSVAARFISNAYYKKEYEKANRYFNSLIIANLSISGILALASLCLVPNLDSVLEIPAAILVDVKISFALVFGTYIIQLSTTVFTTATFVTNRTDIQGARNLVSHIARFALILIFLNFVSIRLYWVSLSSMLLAIILAIVNFSLTKKLTPELKIDHRYADRSYAMQLARSGCWMAVISMSTILRNGFDLTLVNLLLSPHEMGLLSIARTIPNNVYSVVSTLTPLFTPVFIAYYAKDQFQDLVAKASDSVKSMALILFVPISGFLVFSPDFYALWQKGLSQADQISVSLLSSIIIVQSFFVSATATIGQLAVVTDRLRIPVLVSLGCAALGLAFKYFLLVGTDLGLYAIAAVNTAMMFIQYGLFNTYYGAKCLNLPLGIFVKPVIKTFLTIPLLLLIMMLIRHFHAVHSWMDFIANAIIGAMLGYSSMLMLTNRGLAKKLLYKIKNK